METSKTLAAKPNQAVGGWRLTCPFCGHTVVTTGIGRMWCGPHKLQGGGYAPARLMLEDCNQQETT